MPAGLSGSLSWLGGADKLHFKPGAVSAMEGPVIFDRLAVYKITDAVQLNQGRSRPSPAASGLFLCLPGQPQ